MLDLSGCIHVFLHVLKFIGKLTLSFWDLQAHEHTGSRFSALVLEAVVAEAAAACSVEKAAARAARGHCSVAWQRSIPFMY